MGGIGSGRYPQFRADTTEDYLSIDVRYLKREGYLAPGAGGRVTWSSQRGVVASIAIKAEAGYVLLSYRHRDEDGASRKISYPVCLDPTPGRSPLRWGHLCLPQLPQTDVPLSTRGSCSAKCAEN